MQIKILSAASYAVPVLDPSGLPPAVHPTIPPGSVPPPDRMLNYLGSSPQAVNGPFFTGVFSQRMQQVMKSIDTGEVYQAQARDGGASGNLGSATIEDTGITRFTSNGIQLDSMVLVDGGHGFSAALESRGPGQSPYVWVAFAGPDGNGITNNVVRFPYTPGTFTYGQVPGLQVFPRFGFNSVVVAMDWLNDNLVFMTVDSGNSLVFQQRKISEYKAGVNTVYNTITLPDVPGSPIYQGFFTYQNSLFVYTGAANDPVNSPVRLSEYDWVTGILITNFNGSNIGKLTTGQYPGLWYEPEGAYLYDLDGSSPQALIGMTYYPYGEHQSQFFTIPLRTQAQALVAANPQTNVPKIPPVPPITNTDIGTKLVSSVLPVAAVTLHPDPTYVLQCLVYVPALGGTYFTSQATAGTNGTDTPYQNTIISRLNINGSLLDTMVLHDSGHGTSFGVNVESGVPVIYMNYQSLNNDLISFNYAAGTFDNSNLPSMVTWPKLDDGYDNLQFDWDNDLFVVRNSNGGRDSYIRRRISEWKADIDNKYDRLDLQQSPPVLQGFCTLNDAFFRLIGGGGGAAAAADRRTYLEQYSWDTSTRVTSADYTSLGISSSGTYPGGMYEPEGVTMYRETDGTASVIFSITFGVSPNHTYKVYRLPNIGDSVEQFNFVDPSTANQTGIQSPLG